jgi:hypothetical protein
MGDLGARANQHRLLQGRQSDDHRQPDHEHALDGHPQLAADPNPTTQAPWSPSTTAASSDPRYNVSGASPSQEGERWAAGAGPDLAVTAGGGG